MKIYNSRSRKKVNLDPIKAGHINIYVCGPTVYDGPHLGHGRSAVCFDVLRRYFIYKGYDVNFVSNYTDIDDKMINRAAEEGISVEELSEKIIPLYEDQYSKLGILKPDSQPLATDHIKQIIEIIKRLDDNGYTYLLDDGVYFDVSKFPSYGKLSGQKLEDLKMGARVDVNEQKRNPYDFVLWKFKKEGEPFWSSPWGEGRPGWHIECSAMSYENLGESFDIHGGGLDLLFPHHECEVAQSEGCFGEGSFAKYWIHNGFINIDNEKMSKSLNNFFTLADIFEEYDPKVVRYLYMQTHYRNPINFSKDLLEQAKAALGRVHDFIRKLEQYRDQLDSEIDKSSELENFIEDSVQKFEKVMDDDFDTSGALGVLFDFIKFVNIKISEEDLSHDDLDMIYNFLKKLDSVFSFIFVENYEIEEDIQFLINRREEARKNKDFEAADKIRNELKEKGIVLEDSASGTIWKKL